MKKSLLLIPSLVALSATMFIVLTACKDGEKEPEPKSEYIDVLMTPDGDDAYSSGLETLEKDKKYRFYLNNSSWGSGESLFGLYVSDFAIDAEKVEIIEVLVGGLPVPTRGFSDYVVIYFSFSKGSDIEIYLKANTMIENVIGQVAKT